MYIVKFLFLIYAYASTICVKVWKRCTILLRNLHHITERNIQPTDKCGILGISFATHHLQRYYDTGISNIWFSNTLGHHKYCQKQYCVVHPILPFWSYLYNYWEFLFCHHFGGHFEEKMDGCYFEVSKTALPHP